MLEPGSPLEESWPVDDHRQPDRGWILDRRVEQKPGAIRSWRKRRTTQVRVDTWPFEQSNRRREDQSIVTSRHARCHQLTIRREVVELFAIASPFGPGATVHRHAILRRRHWKRIDVDFLPAVFVGRVCQPSAIGRDVGCAQDEGRLTIDRWRASARDWSPSRFGILSVSNPERSECGRRGTSRARPLRCRALNHDFRRPSSDRHGDDPTSTFHQRQPIPGWRQQRPRETAVHRQSRATRHRVSQSIIQMSTVAVVASARSIAARLPSAVTVSPLLGPTSPATPTRLPERSNHTSCDEPFTDPPRTSRCPRSRKTEN